MIQTVTNARAEPARLHLLRNGLLAVSLSGPAVSTASAASTSSSSSPAISEELSTAVAAVLAPIADPVLRSSRDELVREDADFVRDHVPDLIAALTSYLDETAPHIAALLHHQSPDRLAVAGPSPDPNRVADLLGSPPPSFCTLVSADDADRTTSDNGMTLPMPPARLRVAHTDAVAELVRVLELAVHGMVRHHDRSRAEHAAALARAIELKTQLQLGTVLDAEAVVAKAATADNGDGDHSAASGAGADEDGFFPFATPGKGRSRQAGPMTRLGIALGRYIRHLETAK